MRAWLRRCACLAAATLIMAGTFAAQAQDRRYTMNGDRDAPQRTDVIELDDRTGIVTRLPGTDQFAINFSVEGTIDTQWTGLVEGLDPALRTPGLKVRVTGTLTPAPDVPPMLGGQAMFRLQVTDIERHD
jgi:hypothetical protein